MYTRILHPIKLISFFLIASTVNASESLLIDDFEYNEIPVVRPNHDVSQHTRYLWGHSPSDIYGNQRPGRAYVTSDQAHDGTNSLAGEVDNNMNTFVQYYPYDEDKFEWRYMHEQIAHQTGEDNWQFDTYNRLKFWVKLDPKQATTHEKQTNFHFGTYIRSTSGPRKDLEDHNRHYYHYYNLEATGEWHQVIVDFHPSHIRSADGGLDQGVLEYPTGESGMNYFDLMTRFYIQIRAELSSYPATNYFDGFELYYDPNPENIDQVYSLSGVYVPNTEQIIVAWKRRKDQNNLAHEVRYSYNSIHVTGWENAKTLSNSTVMPQGISGYNGMKFKTTTDLLEDFNNPASVFIGIKPTNSSSFREIEIPLGSIIRPKKINDLFIE